jgi:hypothetical protein
MIRWEEQPSRDWLGYSGEALVATATKRDETRWDWEVPGAGKPNGWRNSGHRTNELDAQPRCGRVLGQMADGSSSQPRSGPVSRGKRAETAEGKSGS